ncbi:MAG: hypothetical protein OXF51_03550, partial [Alphaproteobacteria bacterium]|nr:hypothetical protein [Alphaproteobacteria bacterium]
AIESEHAPLGNPQNESQKSAVGITQNLKDFPQERLDPYEVEAQHPADFALSLFDLYPGAVLGAVRDHRAALRRQPRTPEEHLQAYERMGMTKFSSALQAYTDVL